MGKRSNGANSGTVDMIAFVALAIAAVILAIEVLQQVLELSIVSGNILGILKLVKDGCLLAAVLLAAHRFARSLSTFWYVVYIVIAVISVLAFFGGCRAVL